MEKVKVSRSAQIVFIFTGAMLSITKLVDAFGIFQVSEMLIQGIYFYCGAMFTLYIFYLGIMAAIKGSLPHDGAKIVFKMSRIVGLRARITGCCLIIGSLLTPLMVVVSNETSSKLKYEQDRAKINIDRYEALLKEKREELSKPEG